MELEPAPRLAVEAPAPEGLEPGVPVEHLGVAERRERKPRRVCEHLLDGDDVLAVRPELAG